jgi:tetratricopeptide (TPR) repeat protein
MWTDGRRGAPRSLDPPSTSPARRAVFTALLVLVLLPAIGCAKINQLKAMKAFKSANEAYQRQDYRTAAQLYEEALQTNPELVQAFFYLGNSYDNQWKPSRKGDPGNDALLQKAADNYRLAGERIAGDKPEDAKLRRLALQYLVATYSSDKLNDPAKAAPIVERMIQMDPTDPTSYFALAKIYEDAGQVDQAEQMFQRARDARPDDPDVYVRLAGYYNRRGRFDKTIEALEQRAAKEPNNPEAYYTIATFFWDKAFRDSRLKDAQKRDFVEKGISAIDRALQLKPDYIEALVYKNLLLRLAAVQEKDHARQDALLKQANELKDKAEELRKQKAAG